MARFPKGIVTFLAATGRPGLVEHQATTLRKAINQHGGMVFKDDGITVLAAFSASLAALQAALQTDRHIRAASQTHAAAAGVVIALHTGSAQEHGGSYLGPTLDRVVSLLAAAHPGQIVISASTHDALQGLQSAEVQIQHLGEFRLKDLFHTEQIYQVEAPGISSEFPPLQSLDRYSHNLPIQDSPLIGREQEVASICDLLRQPNIRLLTLLGSSGMGKTRLALQLAVELIDDFTDGVYFVALAPVTDPTLLLSMIAQVLGVKEQAGQSLIDTLVTFLQSRQILLVLDNFEQIWAAAPTISELLAHTAQLKVLVTSQVALELEHEEVFAVPPLAMPNPTELLSVDQLSHIPAVALFVERARRAYPSFTLNAQIAPAVIELCTRLEGLPLAIELVAAQSRRYFPGDMLVMLQNHLSVARTIRRGNTREDTLRPVLDWICEGLGNDMTGFFARLGVFAGGCTTDSASAICNPTNDLSLDSKQALTVLLNHHLLLREELKEGHVRYTMLDAIQDYTRQRLSRRRETTRLQQTHASYYTTLAEIAEPLLKGPEQPLWLARLDDEHHNLRAALTWSSEHNAEQALRLSGALGRFWLLHGHFSEGRQWLQSLLHQSQVESAAIRAKALNSLGVLAFFQANHELATRHFEAALALRQQLGDTAGTIGLLNNLGVIAWQQGKYDQSIAYFEAIIPLCQELGDTWGLAGALNNLGMVAVDQADFVRATTYYEECRVVREQLGDRSGLSILLSSLGWVAYCQGDLDNATDLLSQSLKLTQEINDQRVQSDIFEGQSWVNLARNNLPEARRLLRESTRIRQKLGATHGLVRALEAVAALLAAEGHPQDAPRALGAAFRLRQTLGTPYSPVQQLHVDTTKARILAQISQEAYDTAWQVGLETPPEDLIEELIAPGVTS